MSNKEILLELLKKTLEERLLKLEKNEKEADASLKLIKTSYDGFSKKISSLVKLREEKIAKEKSEELKKHSNKQPIDTGKNKKKEIIQKQIKKPSNIITKKSSDKLNEKILEKKINSNNNNNLSLQRNKTSTNLNKNPTSRPRVKSHIRLNTEISRNTISLNPIPNNIKKKTIGIKKEKDSFLAEAPQRNTIGGNIGISKKPLRTSKSMGRLNNKPSLKKHSIKKKDIEEMQKMVNNIKIENKEDIKEEEEKIEEIKVEILPPTLDTCLKQGILEKSIIHFLNKKEQMNLYNTNKSYAKLNINILKDAISIYKQTYDVYISETIDDKIKNLEEKYTQEELNEPLKNFQISKSTQKAICFLDSEIYLKIFIRPVQEKTLEEIVIIHRIFSQLLNLDDLNEIKNDKIFWEKYSKYVLDNIGEKLSEFLIKSSSKFDFSDKNIFKVKQMAKGINDKLKPKYWSNICGTTSFLVFLIKDALEYCGAIEDKKTLPNRIKKNYLYAKGLFEQLDKYVNFFEGLSPETVG